MMVSTDGWNCKPIQRRKMHGKERAREVGGVTGK